MAEPNSNQEESAEKKAIGADWIGKSSVGFEFMLAVLLPGAAGWWLDRRFGTMPWLMLAGGIFGFVAGLYMLLNTIKGRR